jgi:hypothetical protein
MAEPLRMLGQAHRWALHIPQNQGSDFLSGVKSASIEAVDRITGPAIAFAYDFVFETSLHTEGPAYGDFENCWPEEIESTERVLFQREDPAADGVYFVPIWTTPDELTRTTRVKIKFETDEEN